MSDLDRARAGAADEDRLPWLEPVEDEEAARGPGAAKLILAVVIALIVIGAVIGGVFMLSNRTPAPGGAGDLIAAPEGDYKVKPDQPGGMKVEGEGDTAFAASDGKETNASIDLSAIPETPVAGAGSMTSADAAASGPADGARPPVATTNATQPTAPAAPAGPKVAPAAPKPTATAKAEAKPKAEPKPEKPVKPVETVKAAAPAASGHGGQVQLGAFASEDKAKAVWTSLSGKYGFLRGWSKSITSVAVDGGKTVYRLRLSTPGQAKQVCAKLAAAGESCAVIGS